MASELATISKGGTFEIAGVAFNVVKQVTRSVLRQEDGSPFAVQFEAPIRRAASDPDARKRRGANGTEMEAPEIADVVNLVTGELQTLVINTVLGSELRRAFPDDSYVGRSFAIARENALGDKRYKVYRIVEIDEKGKAQAPMIDSTGENEKAALDGAKKKK